MRTTTSTSGKIKDFDDVMWELEADDERPLMLIKRPKNPNSLREVEMLRKLRHHNIIELVGLAERGPEITMRFPMFDLGAAQHLLNNAYNHGLPESAIVCIIREVLSALSYLHQEGVIHRAVRAANVWMNSGGGVVLAGFHHAISVSDCNKWIGVEDRVYEFDESLEEVLIWLAPEVLKQDLNGYGTKSDIYSVGILCCELGNGFAPFAEMEPMQMLFEKTNNSTPFLIDSTTDGGEEENLGLSQKTPFSFHLHAAVNKCLTYCPEERPSANEVFKDLGALHSSSNITQLLSEAKPLELIGTNNS